MNVVPKTSDVSNCSSVPVAVFSVDSVGVVLDDETTECLSSGVAKEICGDDDALVVAAKREGLCFDVIERYLSTKEGGYSCGG